MKILIIVPAYNEAEIIADTVRSINDAVPEADILVVNDGSGDGTLSILKASGTSHLNLCCNLGIGGAVQAGYLYALENGYDYAVQIDGDGQHDPSFIRPMISAMERDGTDIMIGSRYLENNGFQSSAMRRFGIRFLSGLIHFLSGADIRDVTSGYRVVNRKCIALYAREYSDDYPEPDAIICASLCGAEIREFPVIMKARTTGASSIGAGRSVYYMIKVSLSILMYRLVRKPAGTIGDGTSPWQK